ncbi:MAG: cache domain-containing protein [Butyrivibrio sp.]|nr:cache domain-containing protein [Butyrivibrio sp.]
MKNRKKSLVGSIIIITLVLASAMAIILTVIGLTQINTAYYSSFEEELYTAAMQLEDEVTNEWEGDWTVDSEGNLMKGDVAVHDQLVKQLDELTVKTGISYTLFFGNVRAATTMIDSQTGKRMEGTTASDEVTQEVATNGQDYLAKNFEIGGKPWYAYYTPLMNDDGTIVGMIFAGRNTDDVEAKIARVAFSMNIVAAIFVVILIATGFFLMRSSKKVIDDIVGGLKKLEDGDLSFTFEDGTVARKDELGVIAESALNLKEKLSDVITTTIELSGEVTKSGEYLSTSAETASQVSDQVTEAVGDISKGATAQAENVEDSVGNTNEMGDSIEDITVSVDDLSGATVEMLNAANRTVEALDALMEQNKEVMDSMKEIDHQIKDTNQAVKEISEASSIITEISAQTNLLSLNAQIEASRAGDYGKGFSVVANEIGDLAEESKKAAVSINKIVETLVEDSARSMATIDKLNEGFKLQNNQLNSTKKDMDGVVYNVNNVDQSTQTISDKVHLLKLSREKLTDIISELSAISQQNAASTEETNASMEELNATFTLISNSASDLKNLADTLNNKINFFQLA